MAGILNYLFDFYAGSVNPLFWNIVIGFAIGQIILAILGLRMQKNPDKFIKRLFYRLTFWGFMSAPIILLLAWFRYQDVYFFSMRFLIFAWLILVALWLLRIIKWWLMDVPKARSRQQAHQQFHKYLPR